MKELELKIVHEGRKNNTDIVISYLFDLPETLASWFK